MKKKAKECILDGCHRVQFSRGLCQKCLSTFRVAINRNRVTEAELIADGKMLPREPVGRPPKTAAGKIVAASRLANSKK